MSLPPAISVSALVKNYGPVEALKGIDLSIPAGSFFGLLGPNGAGKSTLINILTGLASPTSGDARVFGRDVVRDYRATRRLIGIAPQEFNFDRFFSIFDILVYQAGYFGVPRKEARARAEQVLDRMGLRDKRNQRSPQLSGGMKRRLLVAKAMMHDPPVLILDEPTAGVDVELRRSLWRYWRGLNERGKTIVLTTHYLEEAEALCRTLAVIDLGKIIAWGPTEEVVARAGGNLENYFLRERRPEHLAAAAGDGTRAAEAQP